MIGENGLPTAEATLTAEAGVSEVKTDAPEAEVEAPEAEVEAPEAEAPEAEAEVPEAEAEQPPEPKKPDYLEMTIQSCILPLEMRFSQINGCYKKTPRAYRSATFLNSIIEGVIPPEKYLYAADETDRGVRLSKWNIGDAIKAVRAFEEKGRNVDFVTARVSPRIVREVDFYGYIKGMLDEFGFDEPEKLCLEFPRSVFYEDEEQTRMAILSMKLLKVKTMVSGLGAKDCPITPLLRLPFDFVILSPWLAPYTQDRAKLPAMEAMLAMLHGFGCQVIAEGARNDDQIKVFSRADCYGYIPSVAYKGEVEHGRLRMPLDEAVLQSEEEGEY